MSGNGMEFEASLTSGITPDYKRIMRYDSNRRAERKNIRSLRKGFYFLFAVAAGILIWNRTVGFIALAIALVINLIIFSKTHVSKKAVIETYTEGNIVPAMIVSTNPLAVIALSSLNIDDNHTDRFACYKLYPEELPDTNIVPYEKIACACVYRFDGGSYHAAIQAFPLCWATGNKQERDMVLADIEKWNAENTDEYEVIKRIAKEFPELKHRQMLLLDESYRPIGKKFYWQDDYAPLDVKADKRYPKNYPEIKPVEDRIPAADTYNKMIDIAIVDGVYEYISTGGQEAGNPYSAENKGFFTFMSDPGSFLEAVAKSGIALAADEYPLFYGESLATTRGIWRKGEFISWAKIEIEIDMDDKKEIRITLEGKLDIIFPMNRNYFINKDSYDEETWKEVFQTEKQNVLIYLEDIVKMCMKLYAKQ